MALSPKTIFIPAILIILLLSSCSEWYVKDKVYIDLSADEERWFVAEDLKENIVLGDSLIKIEKFNLEDEWQGWNMSGKSSGLDREETYFEVKRQEFISQLSSDYVISMNREEKPRGTSLSVEVKDLRFKYDLDYKYLYSVSSLYGYKYNAYLFDHYYEEDIIYSTAIHLDSLSIRGRLFYDLLKFTFLDFEEQWEASTPTEFIIAKDVGLISYKLNDGTLMQRK